MTTTPEKTFDHKGRIIRDEIQTTATPQQAWEAWADPAKISQWFVDRASGEAKPGAIMTWFFDYFGYVLPYKVLDAVPGALFVLKWDPPQGNAGILEVRIERQAGGATLVKLINSGFREDAAWNDEYEGTVSGWKMALAILKLYLENYFGRSKTTIMILRPASFTDSKLRESFLEGPKLAEWLTTSGSIGKVGDTCELTLRGVGKLTGRVLTITAREVSLTWNEIGGTLELKGFSTGPQRMVGVRIMSWKLDASKAKELEKQMEPAVERLAALFPAPAGQSPDPGRSQKTPFKDKP
jgi:uncharacterized protein YndB with AHSA1/START domain